MSIFEIIWLEADDELTAIVEKITQSKKRNLRLVIPRSATVLQSIINLRILKKSAQKLGKSVSLVTQDEIGRHLATQAGIKIFPRPDSKEPLDIQQLVKPPISSTLEVDLSPKPPKLAIPVHHFQKDFQKDADSSSNSSLKSRASLLLTKKGKKNISKEFKEPTPPANFPKFTKKSLKYQKENLSFFRRLDSKKIALIAVLSFVALAFAYIFIPSAKVKLVVAGVDYQGNQNVKVSVNPQDGQIKGELITAELQKTQKFPTSGEKDIGTKATATVSFYNYWSQESQPVPAGAKLKKDNKIFLLVNDINIPGASLSLSQGTVVTKPGQTKGQIQAENPGADYNLPAGDFKIIDIESEKQTKIYASSSDKLTGGSSKTIKVVSAQDKAQARQTLRDLVEKELKQKIKEKSPNSLILDSATEIKFTDENYSRQEGEQAEDFELTVKGELKSLATDSAEYIKKFIAILNKNIPSGKQLYAISKDDEIISQAEDVNLERGEMTISGSIKTKLAPDFNRSTLLAKIKNKSVPVAEKILLDEGIFQTAKVEVSPIYLRVPIISSRIKIEVEYR